MSLRVIGLMTWSFGFGLACRTSGVRVQDFDFWVYVLMDEILALRAQDPRLTAVDHLW